MEQVEQHDKMIDGLRKQVEFLKAQIPVYESTQAGRERLEEVLASLDEVAAYLEANPPSSRVVSDEKKEPDVEARAKRKDKGEKKDVEPRPKGPPQEPDDVDGWIAYLSENPKEKDAMDNVLRLETKARIDQDWETVVTILIGRMEVSDNNEDRLKMLKEMGRIYEQEIGDLAKTFDTVQVAHSIQPADEELTSELFRLAEATEQWLELMEHLNHVIPSVRDKQAASSLWLRGARIYSERLDRPDYAIASLGKALEENPNNVEAWDGLATLYKKNELWNELAAILRKRVEIASEEDKVFYLMELAELYESRLGNPSEARILFEQVMDIDPKNIAALSSLEGICRTLELWEPLVRVLNRRIAATEDTVHVRDLRREIAEITARQLEDPEAAAAEYETILKDHGEETADLRRLCELYEELDRSKEYVRTAERLVEQVTDPEEKKTLYRRLVAEMELVSEMRARIPEILENLLELEPKDDGLYRSLERAYLMEQNWEELTSVYRRHVDNAVSSSVKVEILKALSSVADEQLQDTIKAVEVLEEALKIDAADPGVLAAVSGLYRRQEEWVKLVDVLSQRADLTEEDATRVELHRQIGEITATRLGDPETAEKRLMKALELDPDNLGAVMALIGLYKDKKEYLRAAKMIDRAETLTTNPMQRSRLMYDAGEIYQKELGDHDKAIQQYMKTLQVDPEYVEAADQLQEYYFQREQWEEAEPLLDLLLRKADQNDRKKLLALHTRVGLVARNLKNADKAIQNLEKSKDLDPSSLDVLRALSDLKYHKEDWKGAANLYQAILVGHRQALPREELVEVYHRLGTIRLHTDEKDKAINMFEKALELDPGYEPSAQAVIDLRSSSDDFEKVISTKKALLEKSSSKDAKRQLTLDIADIFTEKLQDPEEAIDYYEQALEYDPTDHVTLHKVMEIHTSTEKWDKVAETVLRLEAVEEDSSIKAKYHYAAGVIYRDELNDQDQALEQFEHCLEKDEKNEAAFEAIERILTNKQDYKALGRAYRRMFKRLSSATPAKERIALLNKMGDIYLHKLNDTETAMAAFEAAVALDPSDAKRNETLAKLYIEAGPDMLDKAITQHQLLLESSPLSIQVYRTLCELYIRTKQKDKTWCLCQALTFLKTANEKETIFFERYKPQGFVQAKRKLNDPLWRESLVHPAENSLLDSIMAGICVPAAMMTAKPHRAFDLKRKERMEPEKDDQLFSRVFRYAAEALSINLKPEIYIRPDQLIPIQLANTRERSSLVPSWLVDTAKFQGRSTSEVAFEVARQLSFQRLERYLRRAIPSRSDLANALGASVALMVPEAPIAGDNPNLRKFAQHLRQTVPPLVFEQLTPIARNLVQAGPDAANIPRWLMATEMTALRTGLLLCNDFLVVSRLVAAESDAVTGIPTKDRITSLLLFSVSEPYFTLREHLGFALT